MTTHSQAEVDAQMDHARQRAAALKVERHTLDQREDAYAVNAAVYGTRPEPAPYANQNDRPAAAVGWAVLAIVVVCGTVLLLGAVVAWQLLTGGAW